MFCRGGAGGEGHREIEANRYYDATSLCLSLLFWIQPTNHPHTASWVRSGETEETIVKRQRRHFSLVLRCSGHHNNLLLLLLHLLPLRFTAIDPIRWTHWCTLFSLYWAELASKPNHSGVLGSWCIFRAML